ncbi:MAG: MATE family efflux transporter [Scytonematopsis contorta HA4267-MV1]|jgi:MATE family multidrug resistance protein|nr:MATE family efflux transporter [Scytonematopsis contorta HA4267-MV1]
MNIRLPSQYDFLNRFSRLVLVSILSNLMIPLASLVNTAFLGHLENIGHLAGVVLATLLFDYLYISFNFLRKSTNAMTAQAVGRDDSKAVLLVGLRHGLIALGIGSLILILQYPLQKLGFTLLIGIPDVKASGIDYFNARILGAPAVLLNFVLIGWFQGQEMNRFVLLMSFINNGANIVLNYLFIIQLGWASAGAGLATALSQYLTLLMGLILACFNIQWQEIPAVAQKILDRSALKATFAFNGNLMISTLVSTSSFAIFTNLSSAIDTTLLAENGLLMEVVFLSIAVIQGVGTSTQTLTGNFKGKDANEQLEQLLKIALLTSLLVALPFALVSVLFPQTVFGLLTNHTEVTKSISSYVGWLIPFLAFTAIAYILDGYFIGLTAGQTTRNSALIALGGFAPTAFVAWYFHSNHILWFAMSLYMVIVAVTLEVQRQRLSPSTSCQERDTGITKA